MNSTRQTLFDLTRQLSSAIPKPGLVQLWHSDIIGHTANFDSAVILEHIPAAPAEWGIGLTPVEAFRNADGGYTLTITAILWFHYTHDYAAALDILYQVIPVLPIHPLKSPLWLRMDTRSKSAWGFILTIQV